MIYSFYNQNNQNSQNQSVPCNSTCLYRQSYKTLC